MSIISLMNMAKERSIVLPNIQRAFVWKESQICRLMDSIVRGYPMGIVLMWETYESIEYRHFKDKYEEESSFDYSSNTHKRRLIVVLDGQQRLQSLYIALYGHYQGKRLYFNVLSGKELDNTAEIIYDFRFMTDAEANVENERSLIRFGQEENGNPMDDHEKWYFVQVSGLFGIDFYEKTELIEGLERGLHLDRSEKRVIERNIGYLKDHLQMNEDLLKSSILDENKPPEDKSRKTINDILEVFVRINTEGTKLTRSDLVFSMLKLTWKESAIGLPKFIQEINNSTDFHFDNDFVIKCLLAVSGFGIKYDISIFRAKSNVELIEKNYPDCCDAIRSCLDFVRQDCWINSDRELASDNAIIPFVYYFFHLPKHTLPPEEIRDLRKFFYASMFTRLFIRYSESRVKIYIRDYLGPQLKRGDSRFSYFEALDFLRRYVSFEGITDVVLNDNVNLTLNLVQRNYDIQHLYQPNRPEIDHIFPRSVLPSKGYSDFEINHYANYWYLPLNVNRNKSNKDPRVFLDENKIDTKFLEKVYINDELLDYHRFREFIQDRSQKIRNYISELLEFE